MGSRGADARAGWRCTEGLARPILRGAWDHLSRRATWFVLTGNEVGRARSVVISVETPWLTVDRLSLLSPFGACTAGTRCREVRSHILCGRSGRYKTRSGGLRREKARRETAAAGGGTTRDHHASLEQLPSDAAKKFAEETIRPDAVFVTGDIAFSGREDEYANASAAAPARASTFRFMEDHVRADPGSGSSRVGWMPAEAR